ncbi:MAG: hypothetical protein ACK5LL_17535 [Suipraeoptans sp.]
MLREEHIKLMKEMFSKSKEECNEMFNSGMFNEIVLGAIVITMQNLGHFNKNDIEEIVYECKEGTFDKYTAEQCRQAYKDL